MTQQKEARTETRCTEESENLSGQRMQTIKTGRGNEYVINVDALALALADIRSERIHERKMGWHLQDALFHEKYEKLESFAALAKNGETK